jgi:mannosyltransferase
MTVVIDGIVFSLQRQGGISVYFHHLLHSLSRAGMNTTCLLEEPTQQSVSASGAIEVARRPARFAERYRSCRVAEAGAIFHSSYYRRPSRPGTPTVVTVYDFVYERWQGGPRLWVHRAQKNAAIRAAQSIICISQSTKDDLLEYVGVRAEQEVSVIHCGVADTFRELALAPSPVPYVLFVGQRGGYKNFGQLLGALAYLPELELRCVGGGPITPEELAGVPGDVARRVRRWGFVTDEALNVLYGQAVCLVYPSLYEGFGIPVLEAMRAGCPVVSAECKAVLEVGQDALTVVADRDPRAMADAVRVTASSARARLVERGRALAVGSSWSERHQQTLDVYRRLGARTGLASSGDAPAHSLGAVS